MRPGTRCVAIAGALWLAPTAANAERPKVGETGSAGAGISLGDPSGLSAKFFLQPRHALQAHVGFGPFHLGAGRADVSYLFHSKALGSGNLQPHAYVGLGVGIAFWDESIGYVGPRGSKHRADTDPDGGNFQNMAFFFRAPVVGMAFHYQTIPVDIYFEAAYSPLVGPLITLWNFDFALGARYWF
jgi:hypothetical protein